ncbi:MAG: tetratricopeptide repeat protein [Candidatus Ancaeobacter aquaticus]|nr:tetratricopeptide repeat protein [Candidatus Ancaeobacter aquaticus]
MKKRTLTIFALILTAMTCVSFPLFAQTMTKAEVKFRIAENNYERRNYAEALDLFQKIIPMTTDQNKIDAARIRMADCTYALGQREKAINMYKSVFLDKEYSMLKTIAFWKWRTTYQLYYFGSKPDAKIPNKFYNKQKQHLHDILSRDALRHPLKVSPVSQMNFLRELSDVKYDQKRGSSAMQDFRMLFFEFPIKSNRSR